MVFARAVLLPQIVAAGVADVLVAQGEVHAPALDQAAVGTHGQDGLGAEGGVDIIPLMALRLGQVPVQFIQVQGQEPAVVVRR